MKTVLTELIEIIDAEINELSRYNSMTHRTKKEGLKLARRYAQALLAKEKQQIVDAVNKTDENCVKFANKLFIHTGQDGLYETSEKAGDNYFTETFEKTS